MTECDNDDERGGSRRVDRVREKERRPSDENWDCHHQEVLELIFDEENVFHLPQHRNGHHMKTAEWAVCLLFLFLF